MKRNSNTGLSILLIVSGALILLGLFDIAPGWLIPVAMVVLGYYGIRSGRSTAGWIVMILGLIFLLGKLWGIIAFLVAVGLIWFGWSLLKQRRTHF